MKLHNNPQLFADTIRTSAKILNIPQEFVEKDYWICQILQRLSRHEKASYAVWKGGTSLARAYGIIKRFSSDVDIAVLSKNMSQNQQKKFVNRISHDSTIDLDEMDMGRETIKNNRFRKTYHSYPSVITDSEAGLSFLGRFVIFEINTYGYPYPYERKAIKPFITEIFEQRGLHDAIKEYDMAPFELNVLDKRRTMVEKIVSLLRFSFDNVESPTSGLASKIRHFYDLHYLLKDEDCSAYLKTDFRKELLDLIAHDKAEYDRPPEWKDSDILSSILFTDFDNSWNAIKRVYQTELGRLSYVEIPNEKELSDSIKSLMAYVKEVIEADWANSHKSDN